METITCCKKSGSVTCVITSAQPTLRFQYGRNKRGQWYWHIKARNNEIIACGEGYKRVQKVLKLAALLHDGCGNMSVTNLSPALIVGKPVKRKGDKFKG